MPGAGNLCSGNAWSGMSFWGGAVTGNVAQGNYLGTDASRTVALPNGTGLSFGIGANNNTAGGTSASARNLLSGNNSYAVRITGAGTNQNVVQGNYIGTQANGNVAQRVANVGYGVRIESGAQSNTIGGTVADARNVISGNTLEGVSICNTGTTGNTVCGNCIGLNATGQPLPRRSRYRSLPILR